MRDYTMRDDKVYDALAKLTGIATTETDNKMYIWFNLEAMTSSAKEKIDTALSASNAWFFGCINMGEHRTITDDTILFPIKSIDDFRYYMIVFCGFKAPTIERFIETVLSLEGDFCAQITSGREILKKSKED